MAVDPFFKHRFFFYMGGGVTFFCFNGGLPFFNRAADVFSTGRFSEGMSTGGEGALAPPGFPGPNLEKSGIVYLQVKQMDGPS